MKFKCKCEQWPEYKERMENWHRIFAWVPHYCPDIDRCIWLEHIWRRGEFHSYSYDPYWSWEYQQGV